MKPKRNTKPKGARPVQIKDLHELYQKINEHSRQLCIMRSEGVAAERKISERINTVENLAMSIAKDKSQPTTNFKPGELYWVWDSSYAKYQPYASGDGDQSIHLCAPRQGSGLPITILDQSKYEIIPIAPPIKP